MTSQYVWIGIAVGVFIAGIGIGYGIFQSSTTPTYMSPQQMQQMMNNNPKFMNSWMNTMMSNPQAMQQWHNSMMQNPQFMNSWMGQMMNDPNFQQQYMMPWVSNSTNWQGMMGQWPMGSRMMSPQSQCQMYSGNWLQEFNECEFISSQQCSYMNGTFKECESACRHDPDAQICTKQCVPVCVVP
jgi:hypothetical protein